MNKDSKIFIAGHKGLVGSAIVRRLEEEGYSHLLLRTRTELDLTDQAAVRHFFRRELPDFVFLAAARVGGIQANNAYPADFIYENLAIQTNVLHAAWQVGVKRLLFLGSSCIYPRQAPQPIREEDLLTGPLELTNEPYAVAKIAGLKMCQAYNRQHGTRFAAVMPTNLYGPGDNFHPENSHVLPALIRRFHEAAFTKAAEVVVWGTGRPRREFLHVDDLADGCVFVINLPEDLFTTEFCSYPRPNFINIGIGEDISITDLAGLVQDVVGFSGRVAFDASRPDGTPRKLLDVSRLQKLGWRAKIGLRDGIEDTYRWFRENAGNLRGTWS